MEVRLTTATDEVLTQEGLDFDVPEQLPERSFTWVGRVLFAGAGMPHANKAKTIQANGGVVRPEFQLVIEPLSYRNVSDKTKGFEDEYEHGSYAMYDRNGNLSSPDSVFGDLKAAFTKLGFSVTNKETAAQLVGKVFNFETKRRVFQIPTRGSDGKPLKGEDGQPLVTENTAWPILPVSRGEDSYEHMGVLPVVNRPKTRAGAAPSAAAMADNFAEAAPVLIRVLKGKTEAEYMQAMVNSSDPDKGQIMRQPYIVEASTNQKALTERLLALGLKQDAEGRIN